MDIENDCKKRQLFIVPEIQKEERIFQLSHKAQLVDYKVMSMEEVRRQIYFDYQEDALLYLMDTYDMKPEVAEVYLENLYYVEEKVYHSSKLKRLRSLKQELEEKGLIYQNPLFSYYVRQAEVFVLGYELLDKIDEVLLDHLRALTRVTVVEEVVKERELIPIYCFKTLEEEVNFVCLEVLHLLEKGVLPSHIKLVNVTEEYACQFRRLSSFYHLPVAPVYKHSLLSTCLGQRFLAVLSSKRDILETLACLEEESTVYQQIVEVCNRFVGIDCSFISLFALLKYTFQKTFVRQEQRSEQIAITSLEDTFTSDDYVFLLSMNQNTVPKLYKDEAYITDYEKKEVGLDSTKEKNRKEKERTILRICRISNLVLTNKEKSAFQSFYPSSLLASLPLVYKELPDPEFSRSHLYNQLLLAKGLDQFRKYHVVMPSLPVLLNHYATLSYQTYSHRFTPLKRDSYLSYLGTSFVLSYSSMKTFYQCGFRYYIDRILKLGSYEETFPLFVGNLYHKVLSLAFLEGFDFEQAFTAYLKTRELTCRERFLLGKLKRQLQEVIAILNQQAELTNFRQQLFEKELVLKKEGAVAVLLKGTIDKIIFQERLGKTYFAVIDYKSGMVTPSIANMCYGLDMQLPIYLYLIYHSHLFVHPMTAGFYFQKILHTDVGVLKGKDFMSARLQQLQLQGYSLADESVLEQLDESYEDSRVVRSLKKTSKGFSSYSKLFTEEDLEKILALVDEKIKKAIDGIMKADFQINPKQIGKENVSCQNCHYQDLCYHDHKDLVYLKEYHNLSFLGGEEDGLDERATAGN